MKRRIFGIGETVLDIVFRAGKVQAAVPGGSTFNSMVSLGRSVRNSGVDCSLFMLTEEGDDSVGDLMVSFMEENGLSSSHIVRRKGRMSPISIAMLDDSGDARYQFYRDPVPQSLSGADVPELQFTPADIVLFGSYFAVNPALRSYVSALVKAASDAGAIIYYDLNFRPNHLGNLPEVKENIMENIALSDYVRMSSDDIRCVFGTDDAESLLAGGLGSICDKLIITRGSGPASVYADRFRASFEAEKITPVSTIGAGDSFNAGFVYSVLNKGVRKNDSIGPDDWAEMFASARRFSTNVCMSIFNYVDEDFRP